MVRISACFSWFKQNKINSENEFPLLIVFSNMADCNMFLSSSMTTTRPEVSNFLSLARIKMIETRDFRNSLKSTNCLYHRSMSCWQFSGQDSSGNWLILVHNCWIDDSTLDDDSTLLCSRYELLKKVSIDDVCVLWNRCQFIIVNQTKLLYKNLLKHI